MKVLIKSNILKNEYKTCFFLFINNKNNYRCILKSQLTSQTTKLTKCLFTLSGVAFENQEFLKNYYNLHIVKKSNHSKNSSYNFFLITT